MKNILIIFFFLNAINTYSLNDEYNIWLVGSHIKMNFKTFDKSPKISYANSFYSLTTISDQDSILFFNDGSFVRLSDNTILKKYVYLNAATSIIIKDRYDEGIFHLLKIDRFLNSDDTTKHSGLIYYKLDMELNNGKGDFIDTNYTLLYPASSKLSAVNHANSKDVWLVAHKWNSNEFYSYLFSSGGLDTIPVISNTGITHTGIKRFNQIDNPLSNNNGMLKISPNGKKIAAAIYDTSIVEIFDFNDMTGEISNPITIKLNGENPYSLEFSPNSNILYCICKYDSVDENEKYYPKKKLIKWDLSISNLQDILNSRLEMELHPTNTFSLQLGPDGRIYAGDYDTYEISYIPFPNRKGAESGYIRKGLHVPDSLGSSFSKLEQLYNQSYLKSDCTGESFDYPNFKQPEYLTLVKDASVYENVLRLAGAKENQLGAAWHSKEVYFKDGFKTQFSFRLSKGNNNLIFDGSAPGADGLAFVIQKSNPMSIGTNGGGIGYSGIPSSLAIEIDLFNNDMDGFEDADGNHIAIMSAGQFQNSSKHGDSITIAKAKIPFELKSDSSIYYCKLFYKQKRLLIYIDTTLDFRNPLLDLNIDISEKIGSEDGRAFIGFTSATAQANQNHDLLDWNFCAFPKTSEVSISSEPRKDLKIYPIPASNSITITCNDVFWKVEIADVLGNIQYFADGNTEVIDVSQLSSGSYIVYVKDNHDYIIGSKLIQIVR